MIEIGKEYVINNPLSAINGNIVEVKSISKCGKLATVLTKINGKPNGFLIGVKKLNEIKLVESEKNMEKITKYQGKKYREVKRVAKVGELVKITNRCFGEAYDNGNIFVVDVCKDTVIYTGDPIWVIYHREYVVLEEFKEFTLADLKPGKHVVKLRDNQYGLGLVIEKLILFEKMFADLCDVYSDLTSKNYKGNDIVEVFEIEEPFYLQEVLKEEKLKSIWQRIEKSPTQIKIEEIENTVSKLNKQLDELKKV